MDPSPTPFFKNEFPQKNAKLFSVYLDFDKIHPDPSIILRTRSDQARYVYLRGIIELNASQLCEMYNLTSVDVDPNCNGCQISGIDNIKVGEATKILMDMLCRPVLIISVAKEWPVALRLLRRLKKNFSQVTRCWVHFVWSNYTVKCYGLLVGPAQAYVDTLVKYVQQCSINSKSEENLPVVRYAELEARAVPLIKKYADHVEALGGSLFCVMPNAPGMAPSIQFFGTETNIRKTHQLVEQEILSCLVNVPGQMHRSPFARTVNPLPPVKLSLIVTSTPPTLKMKPWAEIHKNENENRSTNLKPFDIQSPIETPTLKIEQSISDLTLLEIEQSLLGLINGTPF